MKKWALQDAKARLGSVVAGAAQKPQAIALNGKPEIVVRIVGSGRTGKFANLLEMLQSAPPGFADLELPPRRREAPRKVRL